MTRPTVFLDMDGVLTHHLEMFFEMTPEQLDQEVDVNYIHPAKAQMFANFVNDNDLQVVLSSDWRKRELYRNSPQVFEDFFFKSTGCRIPVVGFTPKMGYRGMDILAYVEEHKIENYVILDDCEDILPDQMQRFVHVNHLNGLTMADIVIASNMLHLDNEVSKMCKWVKWHHAYKYYRPNNAG